MRTFATTIAIAVAVSACGPASQSDDNSDNNGTIFNNAKNAVNSGVDSTKEKVEGEVADRLDCSGIVREETRNVVTEALDGVDLDSELVVAPAEIARLVGAVVASTDTTALLVGNTGAIAQLGHFPAAHSNQWDELTCDEETTDSCSDAISGEESGSYSSTVLCESDAPTGVQLNFADQCTLFVTQNAGSVTFRRDDGAYLFEQFALGSVRQIDGALSASFEQAETERYAVSEGDGLSIASNAGKSCEERLSIHRLEAERSQGLLALDLDAERLSDGKTFSLSTPEGAASFTEATGCTCPDPGSVLDVRWQGFLKGQGDANLRLRYSEVDDGERCAQVGVEVLSWPEQCDGESTDCGKAAIEKVLSPLFSATCLPR